MAWPLFAAGLIIQGVGNWISNQSQAAAEEQNARFYEEEAQYADAAGKRQARLQSEESAYTFGQQVGVVGKSGVDITSGSPLAVLANSKASALDTLNAIEYKTKLDVQLARARGEQASTMASQLRSPAGFLLQTGGHALSSYASFSKGS